MYAHTLSRARRVIVFSEPQKELLLSVKVPEHLIEVLPNGVDVQRYKPGPSKFKAAIGADILLTYMGRIDPEKNVGTLLKIFKRLNFPDNVHMALMGDGILAQRLRQRYEDHPTIHWLGFVADEKTRIDVLRGSDLFVLPSSVEGLSLALLEAMACGAAPVATDVGADGEVIAGCGRIIDPLALNYQLGPVIKELLADPAEITRMRQGARRRVVSRYAFSQNFERLLEVYEAARWRRQLAVR
jgi:glycosyltransferase involved in cell wall biosynthesis